MKILVVLCLLLFSACGTGVSSDPKAACQNRLDSAITAITECGCNVPDEVIR